MVMLVAVSLASGFLNRATDADVAAMFAWFDGLGYLESIKKPFVRAVSGRFSWLEESGFLIDRTPTDVTILTPTLEIHRVHEATVTKLDFRKYVAELLKSRRTEFRDLDLNLAPIAWICHRFGLERPAQRLANEIVNKDRLVPGEEGFHVRPFLPMVKADVAGDVERSVVQLFPDPSETRSSLYIKMSECASRFRETRAGVDAAQIASKLRVMIDEDRTHRPPPPNAPESEQIAEMIWRLRDLTGDRGALWWRGKEPDEQIRNFGLKAVPALLQALKDDTLTRSRNYPMRIRPPILRVKDVARDILSAIAYRGFRGDSDVEIYEWFADMQRRGEKAVWADSIRRSEGFTVEIARAMIAKYPRDAWSPIVAAYRQYPNLQKDFLPLLRSGNDPQVDALLDEIADHDPLQAHRLAAFRARARERPEAAIRAHLEAWRTRVEPASVIDFLLSSGRIDVLEEIRRTMLQQVQDVRRAVVDFFANGADRVSRVQAIVPGDDLLNPKTKARYDAVLKALLRAELSDPPVRLAAAKALYACFGAASS